MKKILLKNIKISDQAFFSYKQVLIDIIVLQVNKGVNLETIRLLVPIMKNLHEQNEILLISYKQWETIKTFIETFNDWKFVHPCIIEFSEDIINAESYESN